MLTILHGDNIVASRNHLNFLIQQAKSKGVKEIIRLDGKQTTLTEIIQALESKSLFNTDRLVILENILSRSKSQEKNAIINYFADISTLSQPETATSILWESKPIHANSLKKFKKNQIKLFKTSPVIFKFLDSLKPSNAKALFGLLDQCLKTDSAEMVFYMLARQIRLLIQATHPQELKLAPWQLSKLKNQARTFKTPQLLYLHQQLLDIDQRLKTGQSILSLEGELDRFITNL